MSADTNELSGAVPECLKIGDWQFRAVTHVLERNGETIRLEPRVASLLLYLATQAGKPVSRAELFEAIWPGVVVSDEALTNAVNKIRRAFGDERQSPEVIETIPKMGYRLIAPVEPQGMKNPEGGGTVLDVPRQLMSFDADIDEKAISSAPKSRSLQRIWVSIAGGFLTVGLLLAAGFYLLRPTPTDEQSIFELSLSLHSDKPSLAVLPFTNLSDDPEQEYFVDGITEDLITDLSKISGLNVIARNSVFSYKDMAPKPQDVASQMSASHVLEGSVRKAANEVRINVKFIDTSSGLNLWAERFDGSLEDVFKLQDQVTRKVVSALAIKLTEEEQGALGRDRTTSVEALRHYFMGRAYYGSASKQENEASRNKFRRAIELDPGYAQAYAALALTYLDDWRRRWIENPEVAIDKALALAHQAIAVDETLPQAHFALGFIYLYAKGQHGRAIEEAKAALALDPNYASGYNLLSSAYFFLGFPEKSQPLDRKAMQLDPGSSFLYYVHQGRSYYFQGRYQEALDAFRQAEERNYNYIPIHVGLATSYSQLNQLEEAEWEADQIMTLDPDFSIQRWMKRRPYKDSKHRAQLVDGLRRAGLP